METGTLHRALENAHEALRIYQSVMPSGHKSILLAEQHIDCLEQGIRVGYTPSPVMVSPAKSPIAVANTPKGKVSM
jgi:hypothetical protein